MIVTAVLLGYAVLVATLGARWLQAARWPVRSPLLGIWVWQALSVSVVLAAVLAGATLTVPELPFGSQAAEVLHACWLAVRQQYSTPAGALAATLGLVAATMIAGRLAQCLVHTWRQVQACRGRQRHHLELLDPPPPSPPRLSPLPQRLLAVPSPLPLVYCLPGRRGLIVYTTAAHNLLAAGQLAAVLAHEQAHLRERHDLARLGAAVLRLAFPFVPAFRQAEAAIALLVEMRADDAAAANHPPKILAEALLLLAEAPAPAAALGAGGITAITRCERLLRARRPLGRRGIPIAVAALTLTVLPLAIAALPGAIAVVLDYCPPGV